MRKFPWLLSWRIPASWFKTNVILIWVLCGSQGLGQAQTPSFHWAKRVTGATDDMANGVAVDGSGNSFVAGYFKSTNATFGGTVLTNAGGAEAFVAKYDFSGNVVWAKRAGGTADDFGNAIAVDAAGNSYITGYFLSTNINFSGTILTNSGSADVFVAKYNSAGSLVWAQADGGNGYDVGNGIAVDSSGNSYVTGFFYSAIATFGNITLNNSGQSGVFVVKHDPAGNVLWAKQAGGSSFDVGLAIAADAAGNSYITGNFFSPTATFAAGITLTNGGQNDVFVAKYDTLGNAVWARQVKGAGDDFGYGIAVDGGSNSYVTGTFSSPVATFRAGITLTNSGHNDVFVARYDPAGTTVWARSAVGSSDDYSYAITLDVATNLYLAGDFFSTSATFGGIVLTNAGSHAVFAAKYNNAGTALWAKQAGGTNVESATGVAVDVVGNSYLAGYFTSTNASFDSLVVTNSGGRDIFLAQIDGDAPVLGFTSNAGQLVFSWPTNQFGFVLESNSTVSSIKGWSPVPNTPVIVGTQKVVTNAPSGNSFFRLRKQ
ncbi:MAG: hypothetical protein JWR69_2399 [Pedosphaera sp.]|nr:hypothetical protein [Pedosphaera sp.]